MRYFVKIAYDGKRFNGFQIQPALRTVQGVLTEALERVFSAPCRLLGCSRTDAGVHAREFCLTVDTEGACIPPEKLPVAIAPYLPEDLSLYYAKACDPAFHARHDVHSKEYLYRIYNAPVSSPFEVGRAWQLYRPISEEGLLRMREAAVHLIGYHDFSAFMAQGSEVKDTRRTIHSLRVEREGSVISVFVSADGFLYNMVRIIVGTLVAVAFGRILPGDLPQILSSGDRVRAGMTAPPEGLYLNRVSYDQIFDTM